MIELAPYALNVQVKTEINRGGSRTRVTADLAQDRAYSARGALLRLRRPRVRGPGGPARGSSKAHQDIAAVDQLTRRDSTKLNRPAVSVAVRTWPPPGLGNVAGWNARMSLELDLTR